MNNACFVMRTICTVAMVGIGSPTWAGDFANSRTNGILRSLGIGHSAGYHARQEWNPHAPSAWPVRSPYPYQHATDVIGRGRPGPGNCGPNCQGLDADMISSGASQFHSVMDDGGTIFIQDGIVYGPGIGVPPVVSSPEGSSRLIDSTDDHSQETLGAPPKELIFEKPAPDAVDSNSKRPSRDATDSPSDRLNLDREDDSDGDRNNIDSDDRLDRRAPSGLLPNPDARVTARCSRFIG